jgi:hypothetical protein
VDEAKDTEVAVRRCRASFHTPLRTPTSYALMTRAFPFNEIALLWIFGIVDSIDLIGPPRSAI